jgi:5-methylcytosine-specific restriction endonuclease McrA
VSSGRLDHLPHRLASLEPRIGYAPGNEAGRTRYRRSTEPWRAWYGTARWQRLRWSVLVRDRFACRICNRRLADTSQLVCDHVEPHHGDRRRFWAGPFQTLCKPCHDGAKQAAERAPGGGSRP